MNFRIHLPTLGAVLAATAVSVTATPEASAACDAFGCDWNVPRYSQNDSQIGALWFPNGTDDSMLCAPTAAAMGLQGTLDLWKPILTTGWTDLLFKGLPRSKQIANMALAMETSPFEGTPSSNTWETYRERRFDLLWQDQFPPWAGVDVGAGSMLSTGFFKQQLASPGAVVTSHGHYTQIVLVTNTPTFKSVSRSYVRNGGHVVTVRGYVGNLLKINDPWYGALTFQKLGVRHAGAWVHQSNGVFHLTVEDLPKGASTAYYFSGQQAGSYYPLLETAMVIKK